MNTAIIAIAFLTPSTAVDFPIEKNALTPALVQETHISLPDPVTTPESDYKPSQGLLELLMEHFPREIVPHMYAISKCESNHRQFDKNGEPIKSHTNDFGLFQINEKTWDKIAKEFGLDYKYSLEDNVKMARHVYEKQSFGAWVCYGIINQ